MKLEIWDCEYIYIIIIIGKPQFVTTNNDTRLLMVLKNPPQAVWYHFIAS